MTRQTSIRLGLASVVTAFLSIAPAYGQAPVFTKVLGKLNGVTVTSPPSSLTNGDLLDWVMTYQFNHDPAHSAQANIQDFLSPTLQYVSGSLQVPPSWTGQWFDGSSWVTAEPAAATGVGATANLTPFGSGQTSPLPAPAVVSVTTGGSGGDGYRAIPYQDKVYVLNHHTSGTYLDCFVAASGLRCAGYPAHVPVTSGTTYIGNSNADNTTPGKPIEYLDRAHGKLYFPVLRPPGDLGILCADLIAKTSCGFVPLSSSGTTLRDISGIGAVGGRVYAQLLNGKMGCLDTTAAVPVACPGQPYSVLTAFTANVYDSSSEVIGTKIYSIWQGNPGSQPFVLSCFDTATNLLCSGWSGNPKVPDPTGTNGILYPLFNGGTLTAICAHTTSGGSALSCYDLSTGVSLPYPASYLTWVNTFGGGFYQSVGFGQSAYYGARVFNGSYNTAAPGAGAMGCYDFLASTPGPCAEPNWPLKGGGVTNKHYATIADPERPGCMWYDGDDGKLGSFEAADGSSCATTSTLDTTVEPAKAYCAGGAVSGWDKLSVTGLALGGGVTATLTLYDGSNPANLALRSDGVTPYAHNLTVTSLPLTLGAGGLGIGYGTGPGKYLKLRIVLQFSGITDPSPWTRTPPPYAEVNWIGDRPQFCFQTKVGTCAGQFVTNQATAVTTPSSGAPFTDLAPSPAFSAVHVLSPDCPGQCLQVSNESVLCTTDGTKDYIYSFQVTNLSATPAYDLLFLDLPTGVTVTPNDVKFIPEGGFLAPGQTSQLKTVRIHGALPGSLAFRILLLDQSGGVCCSASHALVLPACDCAQVLFDQAPCSPAGGYDYTFTVQNLTTAPPVVYALVTATTPGLIIIQSGAPISPPLGYGGSATLTVNFSGTAATPGATVCFKLGVHDLSLAKCCAIDRCVTLPRRECLPATASDLSVSLSTGLGSIPGSAASTEEGSQSTADPSWTVTQPRPVRSAQRVVAPDSDWPWATPGTAWISRDTTAASVAGISAIRYRRCFCIGAGAHEATLDLALWADDRASLLLNGARIAGPGGNYAGASPLSVHLTGAVGDGGPFAVGNNCLVAVVHESGNTTGLDVFGSVQAAGGACAPP
jgi:hypothetical protein